ncbi:MAG: hypothetical protein LBS63_02405, partial [Prevotellaceae bacterium]|nr:hypothetical protein [Prevotellaceae bacterium]
PALAGFDGVIAAVHDSPQAGWLAPSTKSKQPARLALEGCRMADKMHGLLEGRSSAAQDGKDFNATYTRFTEAEKQTQSAQLAAQPTASGCLHCDCDEKATCKLRRYAAEHGIKSSRYGKSSPTEALKWQSAGRLRFEQAKCIRCGLCVYNSRNGFTFQHRGFAMQVVLPPENVGNVTESLASLCPTGALYTAAN